MPDEIPRGLNNAGKNRRLQYRYLAYLLLRQGRVFGTLQQAIWKLNYLWVFAGGN